MLNHLKKDYSGYKELGEVAMKKFHWMTGLGVVALLLSSCTGNSNVSTAPQPKSSVNSVPVNPKPPAPSSKRLEPVQGLTPPTNPMTLSIPKGRIDPFSSVAVSPIKQSVATETTKPAQTKQDATKPAQNKQNVTKPAQNKQNVTKPAQNKQNVTKPKTTKPDKLKTQIKPNPNQKSTSPTKPPSVDRKVPSNPVARAPVEASKTKLLNPPPAPAPSSELARGVEVNGVIKVGGKVSAIVKTPDENTSRYVSAGEYLSGGAVLVKRIELESNQEPRVILVQNGVEVIKPVSSTNGPVASLQ